jgi:3-phenylpropionate/trans-cinnamate dioxygenase ferredoxin subunit
MRSAVAATHELKPGEMKRVSLDGKRLLLANAEGQYYCVDEMCSHEDYSLYFGCIQGKRIKCSLHGSYFDLASGQPLNEPAECPIRTYPVSVVDGRVWVETAG